jgi:4-hydroxy-tetrahydrodipicolinate synthase
MTAGAPIPTALSGGTWFIAPTPFDAAGELDLDSLAAVVQAAVRWGCDGVTVLGVMGEVASLTDDERTRVIGTVGAALAGSVPFAVGCSGGAAHLVRSRIAAAAAAGAGAAMVSAPPLAPDAQVLPGFFAAASAGSEIPVIVQDEPVATGVRISVPVLSECLQAAASTVVKLEDPPTPPKISALLAASPGLTVFGGLGGVSALQELGRGAAGTMTGFAFPEVLRAVRRAFEGGAADRAAAIFDRYLPLLAFEGQVRVGLGIRKEVLHRRGVLACPRTRSGPGGLDPVTAAELDGVLERVGLRPGPDAVVVE